MVNNVGTTTQTLGTNLGDITSYTTSDSITIITGELGLGCLIFDSDGTLGVVTTFTSESEFEITTHARSINISTILELSY